MASPSASPSPSPPAVVVAPPFERVLDGPRAGLAANGGRDHLDLAEVASLEENQPLALTRFRSWGWVDEATRSWGGQSPHFDESLLLLTRLEGAHQAFDDLVSEKLVPPLVRASCPAGLGVDECAEGASGPNRLLLARLDVYVIELSGTGVDLEAEAAAQAAKLRAG